MFLRILAALLLALWLVRGSAGESGRDLLIAEQHLNQGRPGEALELLAPLESEMGGDVTYDYLYGLALLETGEDRQASLVLERVVAADPLFAGARMELARAYFSAGAYVEARREFNALLGMGPPAAARRAIDEYLAAIDSRLSERMWHRDALLRTVVGHDSNANAATANNDFLDFTLDEQSREASSEFFEVDGAMLLRKAIRDGLLVDMAFDFQGRRYPDASFLNSIGGNARAGLRWVQKGESRGVNLRTYRLYVDGDFNNRGWSLEGTWDRSLGDMTRAGLFGRLDAIRYEDDIDIKDVNQALVGVSATRLMGTSRRAMITGSLLAGRDEATDKDSPYSRYLYGIRMQGNWRATESGSIRLGAGYQRSYYDSVFYEPTYTDDREDKRWDAEARWFWFFDTDWRLDVGVAYSDNDSNVSLFDYDRLVMSMGLSRNWQ